MPSLENHQERHAAIQRGVEAAQTLAGLEGVVREHQDHLVQELVALYRSGRIEHDTLLGKVAEIHALETLISELESRQRRGIVARDQELGNGKAK
jgi:hypothetical protein